VAPSALDVLLVAVQDAGMQVHGDGERWVAAQRREEDYAQKVAIGVEVVVCGMPGKPACLADFIERQDGSRSVTLLDRPRGSTSLQGRGDRRDVSLDESGFALKRTQIRLRRAGEALISTLVRDPR